MEDTLDIIASFGVGNFIDVGKIFAPMILFNPLVNVAAPRIVSRQCQNVIAFELVLKLGKIPRAVADIRFGFAQIAKNFFSIDSPPRTFMPEF